MSSYTEFLASKSRAVQQRGFELETHYDFLWDWQHELVEWACRMGTAALFEDCGLGKTRQQLAWAHAIYERTGRSVLIVAPLAVAEQTRREGIACGLNVKVCRTQFDCHEGINITNYEMLEHFTPGAFAGIVLDESSILKGYGSSTRQLLNDFAEGIPYRLCCTATPAPNDLIEIINHAEFLGILRGKEIIARFFIQDGNTTHKWRLKGHAYKDFYRWMATWARAVRKPSDLGYPDDGFDLPELRIHKHLVDGHVSEGYLVPVIASSLQERQQARRESLTDRVSVIAEIANSTTEPMLVWCDYNAESEMLRRTINGAVEVKGSDTPAHKASAMIGFSDGTHRVLVTKPSIAGFGMNWQHCNMMGFAGLSDSFEQFYQAIRRCYRFGQKRPVNVHISHAETEEAVIQNIMRKQRDTEGMMGQLVAHMNAACSGRAFTDSHYHRNEDRKVPSWLQK